MSNTMNTSDFTTGTALDCSRATWGASQFIQQSLEVVAETRRIAEYDAYATMTPAERDEYRAEWYRNAYALRELSAGAWTGQKVFRKKSAEPPTPPHLRLSPLDPCERVKLLPSRTHKSLARELWDGLKDSLRKRLSVSLGGGTHAPA